jgi:hypothetical protein
VTEKQLQVDGRFVTRVDDPNGSGYPERTFAVDGGNRGTLGTGARGGLPSRGRAA